MRLGRERRVQRRAEAGAGSERRAAAHRQALQRDVRPPRGDGARPGVLRGAVSGLQLLLTRLDLVCVSVSLGLGQQNRTAALYIRAKVFYGVADCGVVGDVFTP